MMRYFCFMIWVLFGVCIFLSGCRAAVSAGSLEAAFSLGAPGVVAPDIQEVGVDKDRVKPE